MRLSAPSPWPSAFAIGTFGTPPAAAPGVEVVPALELLLLLHPASNRIVAAAMLSVLSVRVRFFERNFIIPSR